MKLLLNIGPRPDGAIPEAEEEILLEIGRWLAINGEAIYATRPWKVYGEGPTEVVGGQFADTKRPAFTAQDVRFTKGDVLYASVLGWPERGEATIQSLGAQLTLHTATPSLLAVDALHLPGVEGVQSGVATLRAERHAHAVLAPRVDAHRHALPAVHKHLNDALVHEHMEPQRLLRLQVDGAGLRRPTQDVRKLRGVGRVNRDQAVGGPAQGLPFPARIALPVPIAALSEEEDARDLLPPRRAQHVQLDHRRAHGVQLGDELHRVALDALQNHFTVSRQAHRGDVLMAVAQRGDTAGGLDAQLVALPERQPSRQAHDLVPAHRRLGRVHVKDHDDPA
ncbi:MAG: hypothetical protein FJZ90_16980, partial [Chloroflexi bacterium]|nr:hypothetical protein [Chloroflexota bacterium]